MHTPNLDTPSFEDKNMFRKNRRKTKNFRTYVLRPFLTLCLRKEFTKFSLNFSDTL